MTARTETRPSAAASTPGTVSTPGTASARDTAAAPGAGETNDQDSSSFSSEAQGQAERIRRARALTADFAAEFPFAPHFLDHPDGALHYLDEGPATGGSEQAGPLLAIHGNPSWSFLYRNLVRDLRPTTRLIAPDHLGCGLSDKPAAGPYTLSAHIQRLCSLVEQLDLTNITLCVHDWGGAIGMGCALELPDRFSRLIILNSGAFPPFPGGGVPARINICRAPLLGPVLMRGLNAFGRAAGRMTSVRPLGPEARRGFIAPYGSWAERVALDAFVRDIPTSPRHPSYPVLTRIAAGLPSLAHLPALIVWGEQDWCFTPAFRQRWQEAFPAARTETIADAGHWLLEDAPERALPWIREFLTKGD
ncbi:MAG: alpha/beta fold hydrolase [Planctomycetota bacterium]|nr:alpha/beta fold hydrolase [Planctomycetota bacterium]